MAQFLMIEAWSRLNRDWFPRCSSSAEMAREVEAARRRAGRTPRRTLRELFSKRV